MAIKFAMQKEAKQWFDHGSLPAVDFFYEEEFVELSLSGNYDFIIHCPEVKFNLDLILYENTSNLNAQRKTSKKPQYRQDRIDLRGFINKQGASFPASKKNLFSQAIGRNTNSVTDVTGGWLGDTLLMCSQNYPVTVIERHWLLQGFISHAIENLSKSQWLNKNRAPLPKLICSSAMDYLQNNDITLDCVYIDPMFPAKQKQSAAVRKSMRVLHDLVGADSDSKLLYLSAMQSNAARVVVKRPDYAPSFDQFFEAINPPTETLQGKLVRYDVYIR